jgi:hypothetical protein
MRRTNFAIVCVAASISAALGSPAQSQTVVVVNGPTIVAFFEPVSDKAMEKDAGTNEALSDFQLYARQVRGPLQRRSIEFQEIYATSFRLRDGKQVVLFRPGKVKVGYYFVAPGKKPRIKYGVMTDADILQMADEYFGTAAR